MQSDEPAPGIPPRAGRPNSRQAAWAIVAATLAVALVLSAMTIGNYIEVAKAEVFTEVEIAKEASPARGASGDVESLSMELTMTVANPSAKELKLWIVTYKAWVRDVPMELGIDTSRADADGMIVVNGTEEYYFPVLVESFSFGSPEVLVPPRSSVTVTRWANISIADHPAAIQGFGAILNHTTSAGLGTEWLHYASTLIMITDIPPYSGMNNDANLIRRQEGLDITPGTGGIEG